MPVKTILFISISAPNLQNIWILTTPTPKTSLMLVLMSNSHSILTHRMIQVVFCQNNSFIFSQKIPQAEKLVGFRRTSGLSLFTLIENHAILDFLHHPPWRLFSFRLFQHRRL